jgi:hypothetical protein
MIMFGVFEYGSTSANRVERSRSTVSVLKSDREVDHDSSR